MNYQKREGLFEEVYKVVRKIPAGKVVTYGQVAKVLGTRDARKVGPRTALTSSRGLRPRVGGASMRGKWAISPRIVGFALHANKDPDCPCHRVVNKEGRLAPNFAFDGPKEQKRRLEAESISFIDDNHVDLEKHTWKIK